jgi:hypothetical protein
MLAFLCLLPGTSVATPAVSAIRSVMIFDDGRAHADFETETDPALIDLAFPFCPTDRVPCSEEKLAWVQLRISIDTYSARRNDPHDSIGAILAVTREDIKPLVDALEDHFATRQVSSDVARVSFVQGLVQATNYEKDLETGWTDYPKFGIEFLVDEQGDCDDAAILNTLLLDTLGYKSYFVYWEGTPSDHLSTAIDPDQGDLHDFTPPPGSLWIESPQLPRLLHVDGTGTPGGCGNARISCASLGFNEWHQHGLKVRTVVLANDPDLESRLPLSAWNNGGLDRPNRKLVDRRRASQEEIHEEVFDVEKRAGRMRQRLEGLGIKKARAAVYLRRRRDPITFYSVLVLCFGFFTVLGSLSWLRRRRRMQRVIEKRARHGTGQF